MATRKKENDVLDDDEKLGSFIDSLPDAGGDDDDNDIDDDDDASRSRDELGNEVVGEDTPIAASNTSRAPRTVDPIVTVPPQAPTRRPGAPRGPRGPRSLTPEQRQSSPVLNRMRANTDAAYAELDSLMSELNFTEREYTIRVTRLEPTVDDNGDKCDGYLREYKSKVSQEDIQRQFGGGVFHVAVHGPNPVNGHMGILNQKKIHISGPPKPTRRREEQHESGAAINAAEIIEAQARTTERLLQRIQPATNGIDSLKELFVPLVEKFFTRSEERERERERERKEEREKEERRAEERRRDEDRRREEERIRREEEREERKREEDRKRDEERERRAEERAERQREEDKRRDEERKREEREREKREEERERRAEERRVEDQRRQDERERAREEREAAQRQHERELAAAAERRKEEREQQAKLNEMQMQTTKQNAEMNRDFMQMQLEIMEKRTENGGIEKLVGNLKMLNDLRSTLSGEDSEPSKLEQFSEGADKAVRTFLPMATQVFGALRGPQQQQPQRQLPAQQAQRPLIVDLPTQPGPAKALPNPGAPPVATAVESDTPPVTSAVGGEATDPKNTLTAITVPSAADVAQADMRALGQLLLCNIDLAVQKQMTAEEVVDQILDPFEEVAPTMMSMVSGFDEDRLIAFLSSEVPPSWAVMSPRGEELVREAFAAWKDDEEEDEEGVA